MTKKAHLIGLCGAGMSAVARLLQEDGYTVTGSDAGFYPPVSDYISRLGIPCAVGHRPENIPDDVALIVIGKHAKLIPETNPEVAHALAVHKDRVRSFPEVLADLTHTRTRMVVAGSYGKSSLTSLITWCLIHAGKDPGWFIGAIPKGFAHSSAMGAAGPFIFEGDEYPSANWDARSKFMHYKPHTVLLTSATHDHVNIYPTLADFHVPFHNLLTELQHAGGQLIACTDERYAGQFFASFMGPKVSYGLEAGRNYSATHIQLGDPLEGIPTRFTLMIGIDAHPDFTTTQMGEHSVQNISGAAAYLIGQELLTVDEFRAGVASFEGLERRLDRKAPDSTLPIYEGFGSSFEKARSAIDAMNAHFPARRLTVLFEPHTFTWRNRAALAQYNTAFANTEKVWLFAPPDHGAGTHEQASLAEIEAQTRQHHDNVHIFSTDNYVDILTEADPEKDIILVLSSGNFGGVLAPLLAQASIFHPR